MDHPFDTCARCGQIIKNKFDYRGKLYGPECIKRVTGQPVGFWVIREGRIDEAATTAREAARNASEGLFKQSEAERLEMESRFKSENKWIIDSLSGRGDFCEGMIDILSRSKFSQRNFSDKMLRIMADIYARDFGRRNSKKYETAIDMFFDRLEYLKE